MVFYFWLLSFTIEFSRFTHVVVDTSTSFLFLWPNNIPNNEYKNRYILFNHLSIDGHLVSFLILTTKNAAINKHMQGSEIK